MCLLIRNMQYKHYRNNKSQVVVAKKATLSNQPTKSIIPRCILFNEDTYDGRCASKHALAPAPQSVVFPEASVVSQSAAVRGAARKTLE